MSRLGRRRSLTLAATALAVLAAPAAAHAANYTVAAGQGACGGADLGCESLTAAATAVNAGPGGDTVSVGPGTYTESPTFSAPATTISGSAVGAIVVGTISFTGGGAASILEKLAVVSSGAAPGVVVAAGSGGLALRDAIVVGASGPGMTIAGGAGNAITRSTVISTGSAANAVDIRVNTSPTTLVLDSSIISGGGTGAGIFAKTGVGSTPGGAAPVTITGRQITIAGSSTAVSLDASDAIGLLGGPAGSISSTFSDSIVLGAVSLQNYPGLVLVSPANSATATFPNTDRTSAPEALFVNPAKKNFHLRAGAPAIDKVPTPSSTSATDIDGQPRTNGAASDQGGDEWVAGPPPAAPPTAAPPSANDGTAPAIAVKKPTANQRIRKTTRRTRTVTVDGKRVRRTTTTRLRRLAISGTATDPSGVKGVIVTIQKLGTAAGAKCKWYNATKGIVLKSCAKPTLLLAKLATNGTWTYNANARKLSAGSYRIIVFGADNSGAAGNSASRADSIRRFRLTNK